MKCIYCQKEQDFFFWQLCCKVVFLYENYEFFVENVQFFHTITLKNYVTVMCSVNYEIKVGIDNYN